MKNFRFCLAIASLALLAGCTGPEIDSREVAQIGFTGFPALFLIVSIFNFVSIGIYVLGGKLKVKPRVTVYLVGFGSTVLVSAFSIFLLATKYYPTLRGLWSSEQFLAVGIANLAVAAFLGPVTIIIANIVLKILAASGRLRHHPFIPIGAVFFYAFLFVDPLVQDRALPPVKGLLELIVRSSYGFLEAWPNGILLAVALLGADALAVGVSRYFRAQTK